VTAAPMPIEVLFVFVVLAHDRRVLHFNVTAHRTAAWTAQQILEAFPFENVPKYLLRDRDAIYGQVLQQQIEAMGITEVLGAPRSPWQHAFVERIIGSIRRDCLDHVIVFDQSSLPRIFRSYLDYYHRSTRTLRYRGRCSQPEESSPSHSWAGFTTDTNDELLERCTFVSTFGLIQRVSHHLFSQPLFLVTS
jgi:putative transposase